MNAFLTAVVKKQTSDEQVAHTITPRVTIENGEVCIRYAMNDLAKCKPSRKTVDPETGKAKGGTLGFMSQPAEFAFKGQVSVEETDAATGAVSTKQVAIDSKFALKPGWVSFAAIR